VRANDTPDGPAIVPEVDVVVPLHRPGAWLLRCAASVRDSVGIDARLALVDDTPGDVAVDAFAAASVNVRLVTMPRNSGFAAAANAGIAAGSAPYVLLLNQDATISPDYAARLVARMEADPRLASTSGTLLHADDDGAPDGLVDSCGLEVRRGRRVVDLRQGDPDDGLHGGYTEVFGVSAAAAMYRRAALQAVAVDGAVFDPRFVMYKEDVDLAWRLRAAGWRSAVDGAAVGLHARGSERARDAEPGPDDGRPRDAERAEDAARRSIESVARILRQESAKSRRVRQLAWRNQLLLLLKNEEADDLARSLPDILLLQAAYAATGLLVDPWGTLTARARFLGVVVPALRARREWRRSRTTPVGDWLP
jgi:GT2 family glycosyltransferase